MCTVIIKYFTIHHNTSCKIRVINFNTKLTMKVDWTVSVR